MKCYGTLLLICITSALSTGCVTLTDDMSHMPILEWKDNPLYANVFSSWPSHKAKGAQRLSAYDSCTVEILALDTLTLSSSFIAEDSLFANLGKHEIFNPARVYAPIKVSELAAEGSPS